MQPQRADCESRAEVDVATSIQQRLEQQQTAQAHATDEVQRLEAEEQALRERLAAVEAAKTQAHDTVHNAAWQAAELRLDLRRLETDAALVEYRERLRTHAELTAERNAAVAAARGHLAAIVPLLEVVSEADTRLIAARAEMFAVAQRIPDGPDRPDVDVDVDIPIAPLARTRTFTRNKPRRLLLTEMVEALTEEGAL